MLHRKVFAVPMSECFGEITYSGEEIWNNQITYSPRCTISPVLLLLPFSHIRIGANTFERHYMQIEKESGNNCKINAN